MDRLGVGRQRGYVRVLSSLPLNVGEDVVIGVREDLLVRSSLQVYLLPLLGLFAGALGAHGLAVAEYFVILSGGIGFAAVWLSVRWFSASQADNPALQPVVLRSLAVSSPLAGERLRVLNEES